MNEIAFKVRVPSDHNFQVKLLGLLQKLKSFCYVSFKALEDANALDRDLQEEYVSVVSEMDLMQSYLKAAPGDNTVFDLIGKKEADHTYDKTKQTRQKLKSPTKNYAYKKQQDETHSEVSTVSRPRLNRYSKLNIKMETKENVSEMNSEDIAQMIEMDYSNITPKWEMVEEEPPEFPVPSQEDCMDIVDIPEAEVSETDDDEDDFSVPAVDVFKQNTINLFRKKKKKSITTNQSIEEHRRKERMDEKKYLKDKYMIQDEVSGNMEYKCDIPECGKSYMHLAVLLRHINSHLRATCDICGKQVSMYHLKRHKETHVTERAFQCPNCPKNYTVKKYLKGHLKTCRPNLPNLRCSICGASFHSSTDIQKHSEEHYEAEIMCDVCGQMFNENCTQQNHQVEKLSPYECNNCEATFHTYKEFKEHYNDLHLSESAKRKINKRGRYECPHCEKIFPFRASRNRHATIHSGEKPHICEYCCKRFRVKEQLRSHIKTHTGERPYKCEVCLKGYFDRKGLKKHKCKASKRAPTEETLMNAVEEEIYYTEEYEI